MALDKGTGESLFGNMKKTAEQQKEAAPLPDVQLQTESLPVQKDEPPAQQTKQNWEESGTKQPKAKWQTLDKVTVLLTEQQKVGLDSVAKKIMKHRAKFTKRSQDKERITTNTLIRALIDNFLDHEPQLEVLTSEQDVVSWIGKIFQEDLRS